MGCVSHLSAINPVYGMKATLRYLLSAGVDPTDDVLPSHFLFFILSFIDFTVIRPVCH